MATELDGNVAFKCTYNDGGTSGGLDDFIGFAGTCSIENVICNVEGGRVWCSSQENLCRQWYDSGFAGSPPKFPCYESRILTKWSFGSGVYHNGARANEPIPMKGAHEGKVALLTTRLPNQREEQRIVFGVFKIAEIDHNHKRQGTLVRADKRYALRVPRFAAIALPYWNFKRAEVKHWGTLLFRYLADEEVSEYLYALRPYVERSPGNRKIVDHLLECCGSLPPRSPPPRSPRRLHIISPSLDKRDRPTPAIMPQGEREPKYWAFFANPKYYHIEKAIQALPEDTWTTNGRDIRRGDHAIIWRGLSRDGKRGIVAFAEVTSEPQSLDDSQNPYWASPVAGIEPRVHMRYIVPPGLPLWLNDHESLEELSVARARGGTVFAISKEQWDEVMRMAECSPPIPLASATLGRPYLNLGAIASSAPRQPFEVDPDKVDRGTQAHASILDALADFLREHGAEPRSPGPGEPEYDLAWERGGAIFVAEVKSTTDDNEEKQLRLGLGQVLRYRQALSRNGRQVVAVLVAESRPKDEAWVDLATELGLMLVWPGGFEPLWVREFSR